MLTVYDQYMPLSTKKIFNDFNGLAPIVL